MNSNRPDHFSPDGGGVAATRHPRRLIALDAVHNFRDLGGYATADGRVTKWRRLFRADGLYRLTADDIEVVRTLDLRTVIDLRTEQELDLHGRFPFEYHPITFHHIPVMDSTWSGMPSLEVSGRDPAEFLEWAYLDMLDQTPDRFARAFEHLCDVETLPAVYHCAAGKDRTGVLTMLLLGALGVPDEVIVADYALTAEAMDRMREWARRDSPQLSARWKETPSQFMSAVPEAMHRVLTIVKERHGSVRDLVLHLGVSPDSIARLEASMLD